MWITEGQSLKKIRVNMYSANFSIPEWIKYWADCQPESPAILAPDVRPLNYSDLFQEILRVVHQLQNAGLHRNDRVALIFPNGINLALAILGTSSCMTCIPVNPALREQELRSYLDTTGATAILTSGSKNNAAQRIARDLRLPLITLADIGEENETSRSSTILADSIRVEELATAEDTAILLPTSGTTSQPKAVVISHKSACADAGDIHQWLQLGTRDRCLGLMPLYHVHALIAGLLTTILSGGSFVSTPGFSPDGFFRWMEEFRPTWYSAVPTVHRSVVDHASETKNQSVLRSHRLRFARSAAAPLPTQLLSQIEDTLGIPLIETYGMTELRTFITANPTPPRQRKLGSVGVEVGHKLGIIGPNDNPLPPGEHGEVVVYTHHSDVRNYVHEDSDGSHSQENAFFRTGDVGKLDHEGYLFITGRIKETIIRGGTNVSPLEIETALLSHREIVEAVAFPITHKTLGQDIAAAVVLNTGSFVDATEIRKYTFENLADFKVPSQVIIVDQIPRSLMGKVSRLRMEELLVAELKPQKADGQTDTECTLVDIFSEVLDRDDVGINDNFFALGGDSLQGDQVINRINHHFSSELTPDVLFRNPTIAELTGEIPLDHIRREQALV